jgi:hypothetical protein
VIDRWRQARRRDGVAGFLQCEADVVASFVVPGERIEVAHFVAHILGDGTVEFGLQLG